MIYIIDDDIYVREGLGLFLQSAGITCVLNKSAKDFLECYKPAEFDLLILDMHMPEMDGCDLLAYFNQKEMYLPVIVITAYDEQKSRDCAKNYGAVAYLRKPIDGEALIDIIKYRMSFA
jgi:FixJ family two-component response regulator